MITPDTHGSAGKGWYGVDLDGTLAEYHGWVSPTHIGAPIPKMLYRVGRWLAEGKEVRIMTARVHPNNPGRAESMTAIYIWCLEPKCMVKLIWQL